MPAARKHAHEAEKVYVAVESLSARPHPLPYGAVVPDGTFSEETLSQLLEAGLVSHERPLDDE